MLISWVVVLVALVGLLVYMLSANPKAQEVGRIMFFAGLLVACFMLAGRSVRLL